MALIYDSLIAFAGLVVGIGGGCWAVWEHYHKKRPHPLLAYETEMDSDLVSLERDKGGNLEIKLNGNVVNTIRILRIKLTNVANVPIALDTSFDQPLQIQFPQNAVINVGIQETSPGIIPPNTDMRDLIHLDAARQILTFTNMTLNEREWIKVKILTYGKVQYDVLGHVTGAIGNGVREFIPS